LEFEFTREDHDEMHEVLLGNKNATYVEKIANSKSKQLLYSRSIFKKNKIK